MKMRAYWNVGKLRFNMLLKREVIKNYPVKAYIEPSLFCNLRCPACPTGLQLGLRPSASIDVDLFKSAIDEVGDYLFHLWMYNWGEPLLHKQTPEMIRYAKDKGIELIRLSTNLSIPLTDDYIERLALSGLDELIVSLDGTTAETYSKYRVRGEIDLVHKNMLRIQEAKVRLKSSKPHIAWQFLVFRHNEHEMKQALASHRDWGADSIYFYGAEMPYNEHASGFEPSTIPEYNQYHPDHPQQLELKRYKRSGQPCSWLYGVFLLNPNGKVSPCCSVPDQTEDFGEYSPADGFFKVWNNKKFKQARGLFKPRKSGSVNKITDKKVGESAIKVAENGSNGSRKTIALPIFKAPQSSVVPSEDRLICHSCPIPYRMNEALITVQSAVVSLARSFIQESSILKRARILLAYLFMGIPSWTFILSFGAHKFPLFARTLVTNPRSCKEVLLSFTSEEVLLSFSRRRD